MNDAPHSFHTKDPNATVKRLQALGWTLVAPKPSELWRLTKGDATASLYFSGLVRLDGTTVDALEVPQ
jgi:hypothetical protein